MNRSANTRHWIQKSSIVAAAPLVSGLSAKTKLRLGDRSRAGFNAEPVENAVDMVAYRTRTASDDLCDFRISFPRRYPGENLALAGSESDR
jgi:hypothetical protein